MMMALKLFSGDARKYEIYAQANTEPTPSKETDGEEAVTTEIEQAARDQQNVERTHQEITDKAVAESLQEAQTLEEQAIKEAVEASKTELPPKEGGGEDPQDANGPTAEDQVIPPAEPTNTTDHKTPESVIPEGGPGGSGGTDVAALEAAVNATEEEGEDGLIVDDVHQTVSNTNSEDQSDEGGLLLKPEEQEAEQEVEGASEANLLGESDGEESAEDEAGDGPDDDGQDEDEEGKTPPTYSAKRKGGRSLRSIHKRPRYT